MVNGFLIQTLISFFYSNKASLGILPSQQPQTAAAHIYQTGGRKKTERISTGKEKRKKVFLITVILVLENGSEYNAVEVEKGRKPTKLFPEKKRGKQKIIIVQRRGLESIMTEKKKQPHFFRTGILDCGCGHKSGSHLSPVYDEREN